MNLGDLIGKSAAQLGLRFALVGVLPTTLLVLLILCLLWAGAPAEAPKLATAVDKVRQLDVAAGVILITAILGLAVILQPFQLVLVRLLEGYWGASRLASAIGRAFVHRQRRKRDRLQSDLDELLKVAGNQTSPENRQELVAEATRLSDRIFRFYPKDRFLPTALGNVLRAAEENVGAPYGIDVITVWPCLYAILSERTAALVDDQRNQLDLATRLCVTFILATVISTGMLYRYPGWLTVPLVTLVLGGLSYQGALASALAYGEGIRAAVDLHRFDLLSTTLLAPL
jgi:hypothetical protein